MRCVIFLILFGMAALQAAPREIYLLIGQSNMAGRGVVEAIDRQPNPRVWKFTEKESWEAAVEPLRFDKPGLEGVGPGLSFGKVLAEKLPEEEIGLVNRAFGGTKIAQWKRGEKLYEDAVQATRAATAEGGTLRGILWLQGESDYSTTDVDTYRQALIELIRNLRGDFGNESLPVVVGEIPHFLQETNRRQPAVINEALAGASRELKDVGVVSAEGLTDKGDKVHLDADSQRRLGERFADEMLRLQSRP